MFLNRLKRFFEEEPSKKDQGERKRRESKAPEPRTKKTKGTGRGDAKLGKAITEPLDCDRGCRKWHLPRPQHIILTECFMSKGPSVMTFSATCPHCRRLIVFTEKDKTKLAAEIIAYEKRHRRDRRDG